MVSLSRRGGVRIHDKIVDQHEPERNRKEEQLQHQDRTPGRFNSGRTAFIQDAIGPRENEHDQAYPR